MVFKPNLLISTDPIHVSRAGSHSKSCHQGNLKHVPRGHIMRHDENGFTDFYGKGQHAHRDLWPQLWWKSQQQTCRSFTKVSPLQLGQVYNDLTSKQVPTATCPKAQSKKNRQHVTYCYIFLQFWIFSTQQASNMAIFLRLQFPVLGQARPCGARVPAALTFLGLHRNHWQWPRRQK